jgi:hypothetical protein
LGGSPDPHDLPAVQDGFLRELAYVAAGGQRAVLRQAVESLVGNPSWNTGTDYALLFEAGRASARDAVGALNAQADLGRDFARVNAGPRMAAEAGAELSGMEFSSAYAIAPRGTSLTKTACYSWATSRTVSSGSGTPMVITLATYLMDFIDFGGDRRD